MTSHWLRTLLFAASVASVATAALLPVASHAAGPADPDKVLRFVFPAAETGFDPAIFRDLYSAQVVQSVFETLYTSTIWPVPPSWCR
jgi:oligopeptide transport system substrate-binding protein